MLLNVVEIYMCVYFDLIKNILDVYQVQFMAHFLKENIPQLML